MTQEDDGKVDPYSKDVQSPPEVKHDDAPRTKVVNRKVAIIGMCVLMLLIIVVMGIQSMGAEQQLKDQEEARRQQAQEEPVKVDPERAKEKADWRVTQRQEELERKEKEEAEARQKQEPSVQTMQPDEKTTQEQETLELARGIASARQGNDVPKEEMKTGRPTKQEEDPWVAARKAFRASDAQAYYQNRMAARRAPMFFAGGNPSSSGKAQASQGQEAMMPPPGQDSPEAFAARLQAAQRRPQAPVVGASSAMIQPASSERGEAPTAYAALDSGNAHQEAFFHQGNRAQAGHTSTQGISYGGGVDVQAGTVVHLVMETGLSSELPGVVIARVARPVYDPSLSVVTIPSGTKVIGTYNARVEQGQTRAQVMWTTLVWNGGGSFDLGGMPGVDLSGQSGVEADVDRHWDKALAGAALSGVLSASASALAGPTNQLAINPRQQAIYGAAQPFQEMGEAQAETFLELEPTLSLEAGALVGLLVPHDLQL